MFKLVQLLLPIVAFCSCSNTDWYYKHSDDFSKCLAQSTKDDCKNIRKLHLMLIIDNCYTNGGLIGDTDTIYEVDKGYEYFVNAMRNEFGQTLWNYAEQPDKIDVGLIVANKDDPLTQHAMKDPDQNSFESDFNAMFVQTPGKQCANGTKLVDVLKLAQSQIDEYKKSENGINFGKEKQYVYLILTRGIPVGLPLHNQVTKNMLGDGSALKFLMHVYHRITSDPHNDAQFLSRNQEIRWIQWDKYDVKLGEAPIQELGVKTLNCMCNLLDECQYEDDDGKRVKDCRFWYDGKVGERCSRKLVVIRKKSQYGTGKSCDSPEEEFDCNYDTCKEDCRKKEWGDWGVCFCSGKRYRNRTCMACFSENTASCPTTEYEDCTDIMGCWSEPPSTQGPTYQSPTFLIGSTTKRPKSTIRKRPPPPPPSKATQNPQTDKNSADELKWAMIIGIGAGVLFLFLMCGLCVFAMSRRDSSMGERRIRVIRNRVMRRRERHREPPLPSSCSTTNRQESQATSRPADSRVSGRSPTSAATNRDRYASGVSGTDRRASGRSGGRRKGR